MSWFAKAVIILLASVAQAGLEGSVGYGVRSYPVSMSFLAEIGYKKYLWGGDTTLLNGYIRPNLDFTTIGVANSASAEIEIAPINLLLLSAGSSALQTNSNLVGVNCDQFSCQGSFTRNYGAVEVRLGYGKVAVTSKFTKTWVNYPTAGTALWIYPVSNMTFSGTSADYRLVESMLIYRPDDRWMFGLMNNIGFKLSQSDVAQYSQYVFARFAPKPFEYLVGLGRYNSGEYLPGFSVLGLIKYVF